MNYFDLVQESSIGLIKAAEKYDYRREDRFITYATTWMWQLTQRSIAYNGYATRLPAYLHEKFRKLEYAYQICLAGGAMQRYGNEYQLTHLGRLVAVQWSEVGKTS